MLLLLLFTAAEVQILTGVKLDSLCLSLFVLSFSNWLFVFQERGRCLSLTVNLTLQVPIKGNLRFNTSADCIKQRLPSVALRHAKVWPLCRLGCLSSSFVISTHLRHLNHVWCTVFNIHQYVCWFAAVVVSFKMNLTCSVWQTAHRLNLACDLTVNLEGSGNVYLLCLRHFGVKIFRSSQFLFWGVREFSHGTRTEEFILLILNWAC